MPTRPPQFESAIAAAAAELGQRLNVSVKEMADLCCALISSPCTAMISRKRAGTRCSTCTCNNPHFQQM